MWQIFFRFLSLGLVSFGGPAAHIGYFRQTFVIELRWLDEKAYGGLVALSHFLPGPGSSQVGFAIGYLRGGLLGGIAAFLGFTLPSFILLFLLAVTSAQWMDYPLTKGIIHSLKLLAVVVVADAVWLMFNQFCQCKVSRVLMVLSGTIVLLQAAVLLQFVLLIIAALVGIVTLSGKSQQIDRIDREPVKLNYFWLGIFTLLMSGSILLLSAQVDIHSTGNIQQGLVYLFSQFYQVGSMVFGGGHVVLPLLEASLGDGINSDHFLTGYALAQAVPGPMFTLAAFLGAELWGAQPLVGALVATLAIFLPGFLLMLVALRSWQGLSQRPRIIGAITGVNACVVGFLLVALYKPVFIGAVIEPTDMALVILGFGLFKIFKPHILLLVLLFIFIGVIT